MARSRAPECGLVVGGGEEAFDLLDADGLGQSLGLLGCADEDHGVGVALADAREVLVEAAQRGDLACEGGGGVLQLTEVGEEVSDQQGVGLDHARLGRGGAVAVGREELVELAQVRAVAARGVGAEVSLEPQVIEELLHDSGVVIHGFAPSALGPPCPP